MNSKKGFTTKILSVTCCSIEECDREIVIAADLDTAISAFFSIGRKLFDKPVAIKPGSKIFFGPGYAVAHAALPEGGALETHPLHINSVDLIVETFANKFVDVVSRYSTAHRAGKSVATPRTDDETYLKLNAAVWVLKQLNAQCIAFAEATTPWSIAPVDPATVRCISPDVVEEFLLKDVLADGAFAIGPQSRDLFGGEEQEDDVAVRVQHDVCQFRCRMLLSEAEKIGIRRSKVTARVRVINGAMGEVIGKLEFVRK